MKTRRRGEKTQGVKIFLELNSGVWVSITATVCVGLGVIPPCDPHSTPRMGGRPPNQRPVPTLGQHTALGSHDRWVEGSELFSGFAAIQCL